MDGGASREREREGGGKTKGEPERTGKGEIKLGKAGKRGRKGEKVGGEGTVPREMRKGGERQ